SPMDVDIIKKVNEVSSFSEIKTITREEAEKKGLFNIVSTEMDDKYLAKLKSLVLNPEIVKEQGKSLKVVYTTLHGTGNMVKKKKKKKKKKKEEKKKKELFNIVNT